ncbi:hypothetical protein SAMN04487905_107127 [Actinopolyspora xinjiangensis]|uniref:Uncharacterized protein n=1 Tax=Actinopolyspora xinjiangensis TaxID=405564 RepID=A0A1H0UU26_9ACTN|nr:hypothetical protein SAMN04487905_107127 [Actinopolyspora xinjiangensis]
MTDMPSLGTERTPVNTSPTRASAAPGRHSRLVAAIRVHANECETPEVLFDAVAVDDVNACHRWFRGGSRVPRASGVHTGPFRRFREVPR